MAKLVLQPNPQFKGKVDIPRAGENSATIELTFIHRTRSALDEFVKTRFGVGDVESIMEMVSDWDLKEEFNADNVAILVENYISAPQTIYQAYLNSLIEGKAKN